MASWWSGLADAATKFGSEAAEAAQKGLAVAQKTAGDAAGKVKKNLEEGTLFNPLVQQEEAEKKKESIEKKKQERVVPLWKIWAEKHQILEEELRKKILDLSGDEKLFLEPPSAAFNDDIFPFCFSAAEPFAIYAVTMDPVLQKTRFELVRPGRIRKEENFWRAYFYKVFEIRRAMGVELLFDITEDLSAKDAVQPVGAMSVEEEDSFSKQVQELMGDDDYVNISPSEAKTPSATATATSPTIHKTDIMTTTRTPETTTTAPTTTAASTPSTAAAFTTPAKPAKGATTPAKPAAAASPAKPAAVAGDDDMSLDNLESMLADVDVEAEIGDIEAELSGL